MLVKSTCFANSLITPLVAIRFSVPHFVQKRMVSTPPGPIQSPHEQGEVYTGRTYVEGPTGRTYVPDSSRILIPAETFAEIEKFRMIKSESVEPESYMEPKHFVQRFKISQEEARDIALPPPQPPMTFRSDQDPWVPNPPLEVTPRTLKWSQLISLAVGVYASDGPGCSEAVYQRSLFYALYNIDIPCIMERPVQVTTEGLSVPMGRVDLEVCRRFVLELKISSATAITVRKDRLQLQRYLRTYKKLGLKMERAALVYFGNGEVRVVEVAIGGEATGRPY